MNAYLQLTLAQLRLFSRNRQVLFWTLFFPIFFMTMLGSFLGEGGNQSLSGIILDQDNSMASAALVSALEGQAAIQFTAGKDKVAAMKALKEGDIHVVVSISSGYGEAVDEAAGAAEALGPEAADPDAEVPAAGAANAADPTLPDAHAITVYYDETNVIKSELALMAVHQVVDGVSKELAGYEPVITVHAEGVQSLNLQYIDFLVPGIVAMMIMSNNLNGVAGQISSWRERGILRRMQSTPMSASTFIAAQITARLVLNGAQAMIVLLVGSLFFGTQVNGSWLLLLFFVILGTLAFMAIGFIIAGLAKTPESASPIAGFISFPMLFLGGVFFPIKSMPEMLQPFVKALPISHLTTSLRQVMNVGADLSVLWGEAVLLGGWLVIAFIIASFTFKWE